MQPAPHSQPGSVETVQPDVLALLQRLGISNRPADDQKQWIKERANIDAAAPPLTKPERALLQTFARGDEAQKKPKDKKSGTAAEHPADAPAGGKVERAVDKRPDLGRASRWLTKAARSPSPTLKPKPQAPAPLTPLRDLPLG